MSDPLTLVQNAYAAFGRGDIPALLQLLSDDVEWRFVGDRAPSSRSERSEKLDTHAVGSFEDYD